MALAIALVTLSTMSSSGQVQVLDRLMAVDDEIVAFPDVELSPQISENLSTRHGDSVFSVSNETDREVLRAESGDNHGNAVY